MEVELNVTLQCGNNIWKKGLIMDDEKVPFPADILREIATGAKTIKIVKRNPAKTPKVEIESEDELDMFNFDLSTSLKDDEQVKPKKLCKSRVIKMNKTELSELINDEVETADKTRLELINIVLEKFVR